MLVWLRWIALLGAFAFCLSACAPHYRVYMTASHESTGAGGWIHQSFTDAEIRQLKERMASIAEEDWGMHPIPRLPPGTYDPKAVTPISERREGWQLVGDYGGPYPGGKRSLEYDHPAYMLCMMVWARDDDRVIEVWVTDWRSGGVTERLEKLREQVSTALEDALPEGRLEVETRAVGRIAP